MSKPYWVYIVLCADDTLYTGIAVDVDARIATHNAGNGAKYTKTRRPVECVYREECVDKSTALKRELAIKRLTRSEKEQLIARGAPMTMADTKQSEQNAHPEFDEFVETIAALRTPGSGCPWDLEQTHQTIASNMIEEAYEAVDAIEQEDVPHMREELGDVLLQVVLQSQIAADEGEFTIDDVCRDINTKIVRRHPHVFGDVEGGSANEVIALWDKIKLQEKEAAAEAAVTSGEDAPKPKGLLDGVPASFPALIQAQKISRKAAAAGFEWETVADVWDKVAEETAEFKDAYVSAPKDDRGVLLHGTPEFAAAEMEFGDLLFSLVNVARKSGIDSEKALRESCRKFRERWASMEDAARQQERDIENLAMDELEALWQAAKKID